ncbi:MAG: hypothetical protein U1F36_08590 [Planctomycetota bacterium]
MNHDSRVAGYRIRISPLDGFLFGLGLWTAWAIVTFSLRQVTGVALASPPGAGASVAVGGPD